MELKRPSHTLVVAYLALFVAMTGTATAATNTTVIPTVQEFFDTYGQIFYDIPKTGETNSHQYLVNQSGAYIGNEGNNEEVTALLAEVTSLREENLQLQQQLLNIQTPNG